MVRSFGIPPPVISGFPLTFLFSGNLNEYLTDLPCIPSVNSTGFIGLLPDLYGSVGLLPGDIYFTELFREKLDQTTTETFV